MRKDKRHETVTEENLRDRALREIHSLVRDELNGNAGRLEPVIRPVISVRGVACLVDVLELTQDGKVLVHCLEPDRDGTVLSKADVMDLAGMEKSALVDLANDLYDLFP
ncbi:hypothetical protein OpiT1DRAFT_00019 [Opitutaceae bacterium TAV1]|nr:hypothetical protein OpiT1DRAFT_00019 [Opitutaceae bacterium TAV1]